MPAYSTSGALTSRELETLVSDVYKRQGYRVEETAQGQDGGVDLVLRRDDRRYFVQCKHWRSSPVNAKFVERKGAEPFFGATRSGESEAVEKPL